MLRSHLFLSMKCKLRDLCVRWSFGRCFFEKCTKVFCMVFAFGPYVDCQLANLKTVMRHPFRVSHRAGVANKSRLPAALPVASSASSLFVYKVIY